MESVSQLNFDVVKEYLNSGKSGALSPEYQKMLDICLDVYQLQQVCGLRPCHVE